MERVKRFLKGSAAISIGTIVGGILSYVFSASMGRMLGPSLFGDLGTISALLIIIASAGGAVSTVTMHYTGRIVAENRFKLLAKLHRKFSYGLLLLSIVLIFTGYVLAPTISRLFAISDGGALRFSLLSVVLSLLIVVNRGILQGAQRFISLSVSNIIEIAAKVILAVLLVKVGLSLFGAVAAIVLSTLIAYVFTHFSIKDLIHRSDGYTPADSKGEINRGDVLSYAIPTLFTTLFLLVFMNLDIILVKRYFEPVIAGQYVAVSTIAKIIFYVTSPISTVMFPLITEQQAKGEKHYQTLMLSLFATVLASALLLGVYSYWRDSIVVALYGTDYKDLGYLLPEAAWLIIFLSLVNLMTNYFMSIRRFVFIVFYPIVLILLFVYAMDNHSSIFEIIRSLQLSVGALFLMMVIYYLATKRLQIISLWRNIS